MPNTRDRSLTEAIDAAGGPAALAQFINAAHGEEPITSQAISQWLRCPPKRVLVVERAGKVSRYRLRPDIYGEAPRQQRAA